MARRATRARIRRPKLPPHPDVPVLVEARCDCGHIAARRQLDRRMVETRTFFCNGCGQPLDSMEWPAKYAVVLRPRNAPVAQW